jgi:hypothetical protein
LTIFLQIRCTDGPQPSFLPAQPNASRLPASIRCFSTHVRTSSAQSPLPIYFLLVLNYKSYLINIF